MPKTINRYGKPIVTCARCKQDLSPQVVKRCPNEAVNRLLGENICIYCCRKCKFHTKHPMCGAVGCSYSSGGDNT